jgi:hypothetical protein
VAADVNRENGVVRREVAIAGGDRGDPRLVEGGMPSGGGPPRSNWRSGTTCFEKSVFVQRLRICPGKRTSLAERRSSSGGALAP